MRETERTRRDFLRTGAAGVISVAGTMAAAAAQAKTKPTPNILVIFCDDLGYGDLGVFGHPTIKTPSLDRMAAEGQKWTNFYAAAPVCTPSRAALMTGRLPIRNGMCHDRNVVLFPDSLGGLPPEEITMAEMLRGRGYFTACVGKWHLGHLPPHLPTSQGFDYYYGIPYSNDMDFQAPPGIPAESRAAFNRRAIYDPKSEYFNVPLMRNREIIERPADQSTITRRYAEETIRLIRESGNRPFFIYLAHNLPHVPLFASNEFRGKSLRGIYGDVVEEIDTGVGQILETLRKEKKAQNTLVCFTSDNGPWLTYAHHGGSAGLLKEGKGSTWEGGMREPAIFWWPRRIKPGTVTHLGSTLDLFATACALSGARPPADREMDSLDLSPALFSAGPSPRQTMFFYRGTKLYAVRKGAYKAHFFTRAAYGKDLTEYAHEPPLLYNLGVDPSERFDVAAEHPDVVADLNKEAQVHLATVKPVKNQLEERRKPSGQ